ncbi:hypothetical protein [Acidovorax temperans]
MIEALSGVQALSAAPAAKKSALRTYPNPIVPLIKPVSEQEKMRALYLASSNLMAYLGRNGAIHSDGHAADAMMDCLNDLDGGGFDETLFAASPTPPAEQQAAPKAEPGELSADSLRHQNKLLAETLGACILASGIVRKDIDGFTGPELLHFGEDLRSMLEVAPQQEAQEPVAWLVTWAGGEHNYVQAHASELPAVDQGRRMAGTVTPLYTAPQPAPLSDDVVKDAARWRMAALIGNEVMLHPEKRTHATAVKAYMDATHSGSDLTGAVDAAIAAQGGKDAG